MAMGLAMSRLALPNGDDHPEAAGKHLDDASVLLMATRYDGTAYLSGYVVECCLKSLIQFETSTPPHGHDLPSLSRRASQACLVSAARTARYLSAAMGILRPAAIMEWNPGIRYQAPSISRSQAKTWRQEAEAVYLATVGQMRLDGVL